MHKINVLNVFDPEYSVLITQGWGGGGEGLLGYISDGDVRSPFLGLKFAI